jgi:hypothetical protein
MQWKSLLGIYASKEDIYEISLSCSANQDNQSVSDGVDEVDVDSMVDGETNGAAENDDGRVGKMEEKEEKQEENLKVAKNKRNEQDECVQALKKEENHKKSESQLVENGGDEHEEGVQNTNEKGSIKDEKVESKNFNFWKFSPDPCQTCNDEIKKRLDDTASNFSNHNFEIIIVRPIVAIVEEDIDDDEDDKQRISKSKRKKSTIIDITKPSVEPSLLVPPNRRGQPGEIRRSRSFFDGIVSLLSVFYSI